MRKALASLILAASMAPWAAGQALPELGDVSASVLPPHVERRIGEQAHREIRSRDPKYLDDPVLAQYIGDLGRRLVAVSGQSRQPFEFFVMRDSTINAFAMPGGFIGVHTGLLLSAQSESEVASVLAHEVAHVTQHHIARMANQQSQLSAAGMAAFVLALLAARTSPDMAQAALSSATAGAIQLQLNYSRDFEREADRIGFQMLRDSGFDVHSMPLFFDRLQKSVRLHETGAPAYLRTHPITVERMSDMQNRAYGLPYRQSPDSLDFHLVRARLRAEQGTAREAVVLAEEQLRDRRYASEEGARYALVSALLRAGNAARADKELTALLGLKQDHPMIELLAASVKTARRDGKAAIEILRRAVSRHSHYVPLLYELVDALQASARHAEALAELAEMLKVHPRDARLHGMQARSYAATGRRLLQHSALAEQYYLMGALPAAIEQLQLAQRSKDGDFYQLSAVEARLRQMRAEVEERPRPR